MDAGQLASGRAALARRHWSEAHRVLSAMDAADLGPEDLDGLADASWAVADHETALLAHQHAHAAHLARGDVAAAASAALSLAQHFFARGDLAVAQGWRTTAERLLDGLPESPAHARLLLGDSFVAALSAAGLRRAATLAREAADVAERVGAADVAASARNLEGRCVALTGDVSRGMALVDETAAVAMAGNLPPPATVLIACLTITTCQDVGDNRRAAQWVDAYDRVAVASGLSYSADCRIHRAAALRDAGSWARAEAEARLGCADESFDGHFGWHTGWGWSEIGEIRLRLGDLPGAEAAFGEAHRRGFPPHPGLALLRLAQGNVAAARAAIGKELARAAPVGNRHARLLEAAVRIALAGYDLPTARSACRDLGELAARFDSLPLKAMRDAASGALALAEGDHRGAVTALRAAVDSWVEARMPFDAGRARLALGGALAAVNERDAATLELLAAQTTFARLGAVLDEEEAATAVRSAVPASEEPSATKVERSFMFTDIVRSTALAEAMGDEAWRNILREHDGLLAACIHDHRGRVVKHEGDGVFAVFGAAPSALECGRAIQQRLSDRRGESFPLDVRIGVHHGFAIEEAGDYFGTAVNTAARIMSLAGAGEVLASSAAAEAAGHPGPSRRVDLVGLTQPVSVVLVVGPS